MLKTRRSVIGVVFWVDHPTPVDRRRRLAELVRHAQGEGLAVLETFESNGKPDQDDAVRVAVLDLAARREVAALVVAGPPGWPLLHAIAERSDLALHFLAEETPMQRVRDRQGWTQLVPQQPAK